jgi:hypothetical protein
VLVIVGMAACLGAASHAPVAITLIAAEACGSISLLEPAIIAVPLAVLIMGNRTLYASQPATRAELSAKRAGEKAAQEISSAPEMMALPAGDEPLPAQSPAEIAFASAEADPQPPAIDPAPSTDVPTAIAAGRPWSGTADPVRMKPTLPRGAHGLDPAASPYFR